MKQYDWRPGYANPQKKADMKRLLKAGASLAQLADELGYASERSAYTVLNRWGLKGLYSNSHEARKRRRGLSGGGGVKKHPRMLRHDALHAAGVTPGPSVVKTAHRGD